MGKFMRLASVVLFAILLTACGKEEVKTFDFTAKEYETKLKSEVERNGSGLFREKFDTLQTEDGYAIQLSDFIIVVINEDKETGKATAVNLSAKSNALLLEDKAFKRAITIIMDTLDPTLSIAQRDVIRNELGLISMDSNLLKASKFYDLNDISYSFVGNAEEDVMILRAEPK